MKNKTFLYSLLFGAMIFATGSCKKLLEEQPRTFFAPSFFTTVDGLQGGVAGIYSSFRGQWATQVWTQLFNAGTDESMRGAAADVQHWFTYNNAVIKSNTNDYQGFWNTLFIDINTANGVLEFGASADIPAATKTQFLRRQNSFAGFATTISSPHSGKFHCILRLIHLHRQRTLRQV